MSQLMSDWNDCKRILCVRPDNMGDLLMSGPAIRALKLCFGARITVLTSTMAAGIAKMMSEIDEVIVMDVPWVKSGGDPQMIAPIIRKLKERKFDAAVIFTVFSQSPFPAAMLAYQAGISRVLGYSRENPYGLLSNWLPDEEPYQMIRHQVKRDLNLVAAVGAVTDNEHLQLVLPKQLWPAVRTKLIQLGWNAYLPWLILHPGVSEIKRSYPFDHWIACGKLLLERGYQLVLTGSPADKELTAQIHQGLEGNSVNSAGAFTLEELTCLIGESPLLLSVNTGPVHIAAAVGTPVVVLYAQSNPQHTPWMVPNKVIEFPVPRDLQSKNQVLAFLQTTIYSLPAKMPEPEDITEAVEDLLNGPRLADPQFP